MDVPRLRRRTVRYFGSHPAEPEPENPHRGARNHDVIVGTRKQPCLTVLAQRASPTLPCLFGEEYLALASVAMAAKNGLPESVTNSHCNSDELRLNIFGRDVVIARFRVNSIRTFANP